MEKNTQDDELIRQAALHNSVAPEVISELLALAPQFENMTIWGAKAELSRAVVRILDAASATKENGA